MKRVVRQGDVNEGRLGEESRKEGLPKGEKNRILAVEFW